MVTKPLGKKKTRKRGEAKSQKTAASIELPPPYLRVISAREFAARFANGVRTAQQPFTWFLGAGCSKTSGILDAGGLVQQWLAEQYAFEASNHEFSHWTQEIFPAYDPEYPAKLYAKAFSRRHPSPIERRREIELICSRGEPAYGYATPFTQRLWTLLQHCPYYKL